MGSPVYAPYPMNVIAVGHYSDEGRYGDYVIGHLVDGTEYYSGHLQNVKVGVGDAVQCGQQIGETGIVNHTHIQLRVNGVLTDFEEYSKAH
jgi:murein DD-endopeptidase MepM/ murein hydrolase activator NlpD